MDKSIAAAIKELDERPLDPRCLKIFTSARQRDMWAAAGLDVTHVIVYDGDEVND